MPTGLISPDEQAFFAVMTNHDLLRYITNFHASKLTDYILFNRPQYYKSHKYRFGPNFTVKLKDIETGLKHDNIAYVEWVISNIQFNNEWGPGYGAGWDIADTLSFCIKKGHKNSFKWIIQNMGIFPQFSRYVPCSREIETGLRIESLLDIAARAQNFEMMEFIHNFNFTQHTAISVIAAIEAQNIKILKWLLTIKQKGSINSEQIFESAVRQDNAEIFALCYDQYSFSTMYGGVEYPDYVAQFGKLEYMKIMYELKWRRSTFTHKTAEVAAEYGQLKILEWMHEKNIGHCTSRAFNLAAYNGHLNVVKWIHLTYPNIVTTNAIYYAAKKGHFHVINWVFRHRADPINEYTLHALKNQSEPKIIEYLRKLMARPERHCPDI